MKNPLNTTKRKVIAGVAVGVLALGAIASATAEPELEGGVAPELTIVDGGTVQVPAETISPALEEAAEAVIEPIVETNPDTLPLPEEEAPPVTEREAPPATEPPATEPPAETTTTLGVQDQMQVNDFLNTAIIEEALEIALPATVIVSNAASNFEANGPIETAVSFNEASDIMAEALAVIDDDLTWRDPSGLGPVRDLMIEGLSINVVAYNNAATAALTMDVAMLQQSVADQERATELFVEANAIIEAM